MNSSNDTLVGKVFLTDPDDIDIELYENMYFIDADDEDGYRKTADKSNLMIEGLTENNPTSFGTTFFKLPKFTDILKDLEGKIEEFIK